MGVLDWLLLAAVAVGVVFALRAHRHGRSGGCCGDCTCLLYTSDAADD